MDTLLVIGESLGNDERVRRVLEREGYGVVSAAGREDGLKALQSSRPAVVLVDHQLEGSRGLALLKEVREIHPSCEAILVTPGGEMEAAIEALRAGALDYLRSPVDLEQLRIALGRARERRQQRRTPEPATVLVIEDHEPTRKRLSLVLEKEGYRVVVGADGEEGARLLREVRVDLVLADLRMPRKDGLTLLREAKAAGVDAGFIVMTGYGDEDVVVQALREGADNFLRKPLDLDQMLLAIQKALDYQSVRRRLAYRNRDIELMQELVVRLTRRLEIIVETPAGKLSSETIEFLHGIVNSLPMGLLVVDADRRIVFANRHVVEKIGPTPPVLAADWLVPLGLPTLTEEALQEVFERTLRNHLGSIETLMLTQWSFLVMTPLTLLEPSGTVRVVTIVIRGERKMGRA
jgi:DNA-binding NtrC family response regulator